MNTGVIFSKVTQQHSINYLIFFFFGQKLVKDHSALESSLATWVTSLNMASPSCPEFPSIINHENG